jgi:predicted enzyme related to lactoylglutathione lyase
MAGEAKKGAPVIISPHLRPALAVRWLTGFLDLPATPPGAYERAARFWEAVTGWTFSAPRGRSGEFQTLLPTGGDPFIRAQRTGGTGWACHLDFHVDDVGAASEVAGELGACLPLAGGSLGLSSPGGLAFCFVSDHGERERPPPSAWPGGATSLIDQLCIDIPAPAFEDECAFWAALTGWDLRQGSRSEFRYLLRPPAMPLRLLLQRLDDDRHQGASAHFDLACDDVTAEVGRHSELGATVVREMPNWTALVGPFGVSYCVTRRNPSTGTL